jgi:hypothetical protein
MSFTQSAYGKPWRCGPLWQVWLARCLLPASGGFMHCTGFCTCYHSDGLCTCQKTVRERHIEEEIESPHASGMCSLPGCSQARSNAARLSRQRQVPEHVSSATQTQPILWFHKLVGSTALVHTMPCVRKPKLLVLLKAESLTDRNRHLICMHASLH